MGSLEASLAHAKKLTFIKDTPAVADEFGTHTRIADSVAAVIRTHSDLKVIGLIGRWGSGKSTVISLIEQALAKEDGIITKVFIYDAWLHQSDPPRRSFLEALIAFFGLSEDADWKQRLAELNGQIDDTDTRTTPTLTMAGRFILISLLLLPIGFNFASADWLLKKITVPYWNYDVTVFWIGICLLLLPVIIAAAIYVAWRPSWNIFGGLFWSSKNWTRHKHKYKDESILTLFMSRATTRINHRISKSPDPTTIEFQRTFRDLIKAVSGPKKRFVFVVDNLDRLPEAAAVELWATIRSFFLGASNAPGADKDQLPTVLLPIDPDAIRRMYAASDSTDAPRLAKAFMDKTFDLTFSVPPPVFSDWKKYLEKQLRASFGTECEEEWLYQVGALYEKYLSQGNGEPTPRLINTLVNDCAILWLQWKGEIPFPTLAHYAINRATIEENVGQFIRGEHPEIARFDEKWAAGTAAIYFGVPVADALQVHLEGHLSQAIESSDVPSFMEHAKTPGFDRVFELVIEASDRSDEFLTQAGYLLGELDPSQSAWSSSCWRTLLMKLGQSMFGWETLTQPQIFGLRYILQRSPIEVVKAALPKLKALPFGAEFFGKGVDNVRNWTALAICILDTTQERGVPLPNISFNGGPDQYLQILETLSNRRELISKIVPKVTVPQIVDALAADLQKPKEAASFAVKFDVLSQQSVPSWNNLAVAAANLVRGQSGSEDIVSEGLRALGTLRAKNDPHATEQLSELSNEGFLFEKLAQAKEANNIAALANALSLIVLLDPNFQNAASQGRASAGIAAANALQSDTDFVSQIGAPFDEAMKRFGVGSTLYSLVVAAEGNAALQPLVKLVVTNRVKAGKLGSVVLKDVPSRLPVYLKYIEAGQHERFVGKLIGYTDYPAVIRQAAFDDNLRQFLRLQLQSTDNEVRSAALTEITYRLKSTSEKDWKSAIAKGDEPYPIALEMHMQNPHFEFGANFYDALKELADGWLEGEQPQAVARWFSAVSLLNDNNQATLMRGLRDRLLAKELEMSNLVVLEGGGATLLSVGHFEEESDRALRYLVMPLLDSSEGVQWLSSQYQYITVWLGKAPKETCGSVQGRLSSAWESATGEKRDNLESLNEQLGFSPLTKTEPQP